MSSTSIPPGIAIPAFVSAPTAPRPRVLRALGRLALGLLVAISCFAAGVYAISRSRQTTRYLPAPSDFAIPTDAASITEGERLFHARGCLDCHGENGAGRVVLDDPALGTIVSANLTYFAAAPASAWSAAVRDGVHGDGTPLVFMPSNELHPMPDRELAAIVAYVRTLPQTAHELPPLRIGPLGRTLDVVGALSLFSARTIDHASRPSDIPATRNAAMGDYLATMCTGCHGEHLSGGSIPGAPPSMGMPRNLTPHETGLRDWTEADFRTALREGRTPDGGALDARQMPWESTFGYLSDDEIGALYDHLRRLPARPEGER